MRVQTAPPRARFLNQQPALRRGSGNVAWRDDHHVASSCTVFINIDNTCTRDTHTPNIPFGDCRLSVFTFLLPRQPVASPLLPAGWTADETTLAPYDVLYVFCRRRRRRRRFFLPVPPPPTPDNPQTCPLSAVVSRLAEQIILSSSLLVPRCMTTSIINIIIITILLYLQRYNSVLYQQQQYCKVINGVRVP